MESPITRISGNWFLQPLSYTDNLGERDTSAMTVTSGVVEEELESPARITSSITFPVTVSTNAGGSKDCGAGRGGQESASVNGEGGEHLACLPWDIGGVIGGVQRFLLRG